MAKTRIYEFAKDLNISNKELLDMLQEMDITVVNHMSCLDDETVDRVRASFTGGKKTETIEEVRIKPNIIRRRKKVGQNDSQIKNETKKQTDNIEKSPTAEKLSKSVVKDEKPPVKKEVKTDEDIKVVDSPKEKTIEKPVAKKTEQAPTPKTKPKKQPNAKRTRPKKVRKDTPAKIIKMAAPIAPKEEKPPVKKVSAKRKIVKKETIAKPNNIKTEAPPAMEGKRKEKQRKVIGKTEGIKDIKWTKKKISFKKKAVIEGAALYSKGYRNRNTRKGARGKTPLKTQKTKMTTPKAIKRRIKIDDAIVLSELAKRMGIKANAMIKTLMSLGVMVTVNQTIDFDTAVIVAAEFNYELEKASFEEKSFLQQKSDSGKLVPRAPVITIMGHVDHGKTSLLDVIRKTNVVDGEAGGITQHIGAYNVITDKGQIVFLDTPGHEAFTAMRARGAEITDLVILVVAADDGVMPQTIEAINHSKAANVPIIVAINKIDKANADTERVQRELAEAGLTPEDWGGDTVFLKVSAKENKGIDDLLEMALLQAEMLDLQADPEKFAKGHVIESRIDSGRGAVATVLVQEGTLHIGDPVVCGVHYGKIRAMINDKGAHLEMATPSTPVEIIGLSGVPNAGDEFVALADEKNAKQVSLHRIQKLRSKELSSTSRVNLEKLFENIKNGEVKDLNIVIKADVHGSIEALKDSIVKLANDEVNINVVHTGTGAITESDVSLAAVSNAIIIGFNVRPGLKVQALAADENIDMRFYSIIYNVIKDIKKAMLGMMASSFKEHTLGNAEVREVFHVPKVGAIAGCYVTNGKIERGKSARLVRDGVVCYEGKIASIRRFKDSVKEVQNGYECGIGIENYNDIKTGDVIECYYVEEIKPNIKE